MLRYSSTEENEAVHYSPMFLADGGKFFSVDVTSLFSFLLLIHVHKYVTKKRNCTKEFEKNKFVLRSTFRMLAVVAFFCLSKTQSFTDQWLLFIHAIKLSCKEKKQMKVITSLQVLFTLEKRCILFIYILLFLQRVSGFVQTTDTLNDVYFFDC